MDNTFAAAPPMGWNSWNTFFDKYDEDTIIQVADAMVDGGFLDCGYRYLIIDDCWMEKTRNANGDLVPSREKFPHGIEQVIDYVHSKGLKFGIYECCGVRTCAGYPGSFEHELQDARLFAKWGVDYLKYDNCFKPAAQTSDMLYRRMGYALRNTDRDIFYAACQWGKDNVEKWIRSTGANSYRMAIDIRDNWNSVRYTVSKRLEHLEDGSRGCFSDMDMLVVGMKGSSYNPETGAEGCSDAEYRSHFALWSLLASPLIIGCDIRNIDERSKALLQNRHLIAINQDPESRACFKLTCDESPSTFALVRPLSDGSCAVGVFNFGDEAMKCVFAFWDIGLSAAAGHGVSMFNCLTGEDEGIRAECFGTKLDPHDCVVYRLKPLM
ncbi:MAG: glycoside hydrolase family 27 protein [Mogibacterium sp.]|nr:glycoside hydrolase family 27 protein [Mogibacterium sp.]